MLAASTFSIIFSKNDFQYVASGMSSRIDVLINSLCLQGLCYLVYYYVTLPRMKLTDEEKIFAQHGKASSFLIHEISKPINRLSANPDKFEEEIKQIKDIFNITKILNQKSLVEEKKEQVSILSVYKEVISKYKKEISELNIKINEGIEDFEIQSDRKCIFIILDNLIKNAIEELVTKDDKIIEVIICPKKFSISNKVLVQIKEPQFIGLTVHTTKDGHMGVGLFISRILCERLSFSIDFDVSSKIFRSTVTF
jgi:signal transduction histidine kinase